MRIGSGERNVLGLNQTGRLKRCRSIRCADQDQHSILAAIFGLCERVNNRMPEAKYFVQPLGAHSRRLLDRHYVACLHDDPTT